MQVRTSLLLGAAFTTPAMAADLNVSVEIPRQNVAEYHRPYVAAWIEDANQSFVQNLAIWYDLKMKNDEGTKWLKDMRQWWRKSGRELTMPVDGISGATRAPGEHTLTLDTAKNGLDKLPAGQYQLVVEAAREVGGRELVRVPFEWPLKAGQQAHAKGEHELATVSIQLKP